MVIDYSERRQSKRVQPVRPQRPSVWPYILLILSMLTVAYLLGIATGWYLLRPGGRFYKTEQKPEAAAAKPAVPPSQGATAAQSSPPQAQQSTQPQQPSGATPPADKGAQMPLTFYNTLQKGNKELMGTGINQPKEGQGGNPPQHSAPAPGH